MWSATDLTQALNLPIPFTSSILATDVSIDTRTLKPGDLYIAIQGLSLDGHDFVEAALEKGAAAVIVSKSIVPNDPREIVVPDTLTALEDLARFARARTQARIIAVTGSVGKTTTKEMLRHIFSQFGTTSASLASYNNHWGVPLTLARLDPKAAFAVIEVGMNHPGEIAPLSQLIRPHAAIITALAEAHLGHMGSMQAIAQEKATIFSGLVPGGVAIFNGDHEYGDLMHATARAAKAGSRISVHNSHLIGSSFSGDYVAQIQDQEIEFRLPIAGDHLARNALLVLNLVRYWGLDVLEASSALHNLPLVDGRGRPIRLPTGALLLDDAYNANPASMRAGLSVVKSLPGTCKVAVLGEMLELGPDGENLHKSLIEPLKEAGITTVYAVGAPGMKALFEALPKEMQGQWAASVSDIIPVILQEIEKSNVIFVKGSKGSKVSQIVDFIKSEMLTQATILPFAQSVER